MDFHSEIQIINAAIRMAKDELEQHGNGSWGRLMITKLVALEAEKIRITNEYNTKVPN